MHFIQHFDPNAQPCAGTGIAVVLGQMDDAAVAGNLHVDWKIVGEAMRPIDLKAEKIDVMTHCYGFVEDAEDRDGVVEFHRGLKVDT